jgi:cobalamin biosynthesis protein CbiD
LKCKRMGLLKVILWGFIGKLIKLASQRINLKGFDEINASLLSASVFHQREMNDG